MTSLWNLSHMTVIIDRKRESRERSETLKRDNLEKDSLERRK